MSKAFWGVVLAALFSFFVIGAERAWATITTAAGNVSSANGSLTIGTGGTLNVPLSAGITYPGGNTISVGIGFTGFDFNNEVNATLTTGVGFNSHEASGNCGFQNDTAGAEVCVGPGANMYWKQDANTNLSAGGGLAYIASATPDMLLDVSTGLGVGTTIATGITFAGRKLTHAATVTNVSLEVSVGASSTAATDVITVTDGTNTCTATFNCTGTLDSGGVKDVAVANGAGTGCVYATGALLTFSATTQGCVTPPTLKNIAVIGNWQ